MSDDPRATYPASLPPPSYTLKNGLAQLDVSKFNFDVDSDSLYSPSENGTFLEELEGTSEGEGEHGRGGISAGRLPEEVYVSTLPRWRNALRRRLVSCVEWETGVLASMQDRVRTPWLDMYFVYTSTLGTHTFFMCFLPALFFFGYEDLGRGLIYALALGGYSSSFLKDLACSPRPFSPPVSRLTIGSHHLEYGFPSTHSTNGTSMALFFLVHAHTLLVSDLISLRAFVTCVVFLVFYVFSIVGGRLYTGMHGFIDCTVGVILGASTWALQWAVMPVVERWVAGSGWSGPLLVTALCLLLVNQHPQPVDDCPCFEDAIAFISVMLGILLGKWFSAQYPAFDPSTFPPSSYPALSFAHPNTIMVFASMSLLKLAMGILAIFAFRLLAKPALHAALPPLFRWLAKTVRLPNRRHYTPATEYARGPPADLRPIPSVMDLTLEIREVGGEGERV